MNRAPILLACVLALGAPMDAQDAAPIAPPFAQPDAGSDASLRRWPGPADMGPVERCISRGPLGSMLASMDYSAIDIVQSPGLVTIRTEATTRSS